MEIVEQVFPLPDKSFQKKIADNFDPVLYQKNFDFIKNWFEEATGQICDSNYENQIHLVLRGAKNDLVKAMKRFQNYFLYKTKYPEFYQFYDLQGQFQFFKAFYSLCLNGITPEGYRICYIGFSSPNIEDLDMDITFKALYMLGNMGMCLPHPHFLGVIIIVDLKNASSKHAMKFLSWRFRRYMQFNNDVLSLRLKKLFIINVPSYIEKFVQIFKAFLSEKLKTRFYIEHSDKEMRKHVSINLLASDYGGEGEAIATQTERVFRLIQEVRPWMEAAQQVQLCNTASLITTCSSLTTGSSKDLTLTPKNKKGKMKSRRNKNQDQKGNRNSPSDDGNMEEICFEFPDIGDDCLSKQDVKKSRKNNDNQMPEDVNHKLLECSNFSFGFGNLEID